MNKKDLKSKRKEYKSLIKLLREAEYHHSGRYKEYEALIYKVLRVILEDKLEDIDYLLSETS